MTTRTFEVEVESEWADQFRIGLDWSQGVVSVTEMES